MWAPTTLRASEISLSSTCDGPSHPRSAPGSPSRDVTDFQTPSLYQFSAVDYSRDVGIDDGVVNNPPPKLYVRPVALSPLQGETNARSVSTFVALKGRRRRSSRADLVRARGRRAYCIPYASAWKPPGVTPPPPSPPLPSHRLRMLTSTAPSCPPSPAWTRPCYNKTHILWLPFMTASSHKIPKYDWWWTGGWWRARGLGLIITDESLRTSVIWIYTVV